MLGMENYRAPHGGVYMKQCLDIQVDSVIQRDPFGMFRHTLAYQFSIPTMASTHCSWCRCAVMSGHAIKSETVFNKSPDRPIFLACVRKGQGY